VRPIPVASILLAAVVLAADNAPTRAPSLADIDHLVIIYEENHSFDNLFGGWEGVEGIDAALRSGRVAQVDAAGTPLTCLAQNDVNLTSPPLSAHCVAPVAGGTVKSHFANAPFLIDEFITPTDRTCPEPGEPHEEGMMRDAPGALPGGCTRDLVHRFYQQKYQINGGRMDRFAVGSDALGLVMGRYDTRALPLYRYLHSPGAPRYVVADNFFQAAFGGSFLNHQWLIAAATPTWPNALADGSGQDRHSIVGADGSPADYPLHPAPVGVRVNDGGLTQAANTDGTCAVPAGAATPPVGTVCGDFAVNTIQPWHQPYDPGTEDYKRLPPQTQPTIGDSLTGNGIDWAWYAGGWDDASGNVGGDGWTNGGTPGECTNPRTERGSVYPNCPDKTFQFHHAPFAYYEAYAPGTPARAAHLRDELEFVESARKGMLKPVSFVKPLGEENEHPGYASEHHGSTHLVELIRAIVEGPAAARTAIIITYDENGGQWDHVPPPTAPGVSDAFGPGTRVPALVISPMLGTAFRVDHTPYDTTSILATIEHRFGVPALGTRDAAVHDLTPAILDPP
jgi:phospholipase C